jgi:hypothetical protein
MVPASGKNHLNPYFGTKNGKNLYIKSLETIFRNIISENCHNSSLVFFFCQLVGIKDRFSQVYIFKINYLKFFKIGLEL